MALYINFAIAFCLLIIYTNSELIKVVEIFRHGARAILKPNEAIDLLFTPYSKGDLTINGSNQLRKLGNYIKTRYSNIDNGKILKNPEIYSLDIPRCINSAINHITALYPEKLVGFQYINNTNNDNLIKNAEIPISERIKLKYSSNKDDLIINLLPINNNKILSARECFKINKTFDYYIDEADRDKILLLNENELFKPFIDNIIKSNFSSYSVKDLYDLVESVNYHFPDYLKRMGLDDETIRILNVNKMRYSYLYEANNSDNKLLVSALFQKILNFLNSKDTNSNLLIFSARDVNIKDIFLNIIDTASLAKLILNNDSKFLLPAYASSLIFELHKYENELYIKIIYNGSEQKFRNSLKYNVAYTEKGIEFNDFVFLLDSRTNFDYNNNICN